MRILRSRQTGVKGTAVPLRGAGQGSLGGFQGPLNFPLRAAAGGKRNFATALGFQRHTLFLLPTNDMLLVRYPMTLRQGLVSVLHRNSERRPFRFGFTARHISLGAVPS